MNVCCTFPCRRTSAGCPVCDPPALREMYVVPSAPTFSPPGCICPPTSEKTCESPTCPRKNHLRGIGYGTPGMTAGPGNPNNRGG
jgi:hypothetical protein